MRHPELEADDLIAGWVQAHPDDHHTIVSSDTDFQQLLAENVNQYNGITDQLWTTEGVYDKKGDLVIDKKTKEPKEVNPTWMLFEKCMRGDTSDNVFSAYPGVRKKGTKNKIGLLEAFEDKDKKGFNWNNMMLQRWTDHNGEEHRVLDDYSRNVTLIDLTAQPDDIKQKIAETIAEASEVKSVSMVGAKFLKFCGKYELNKLSDEAQRYADLLGSPYPS
jgi:5'-3' exonuclease